MRLEILKSAPSLTGLMGEVVSPNRIEKCPFTYSYWLNGRWILQIVDIGNFIMRLDILKSAPSLTG